ncbi:MAG TPA: tetratricopeptide repeat protein [Methylomirabilota bacterium]|nr:tetratricopeptide repeat protein [Methylomirabilota bacterium]
MPHDRYGLSLSTTPAAAEAYVEAVDRLLAAREGALEGFDRALAHDPDFALAHVGRSRALLTAGRGPEGRAAVDAAVQRAGKLDRREQRHVEVLAAAATGPNARAVALVREHLAEFPRDVVVLAAANGIYGLIGWSGSQTRNQDMLALLDGLAAAYGDDWWFLGAHGFARTEALGWKAGAPLIERALAREPRNAHAAHAWAHVLYERGDDAAGAAFVEGWMPSYPREAALHCHLSWHSALFEIAGGRLDMALAIYETAIAPGRSLGSPLSTIVDSASLLWRRELAGAAPSPEAWRAVARHASASVADPGLAFLDAHCAVALAAAGEHQALERWIARLRAAAAENRSPAGAVTPAVAAGMAAFAAGRYDEAIAGLAPVLEQLVRVGGSWAQRDLFEHTLLAAYLRSGRAAEARALLARRVDRRPSVPVVEAR